MYRKLIVIFLLLSFLTVKNSTLMAACVKDTKAAMDWYADSLPMTDAEKGNGDPVELPEDDKEPKPIESVDEDYLPADLTFAGYQSVSFKLLHYECIGVSDAYFTLPYPPPETNS